MMLHRQQLPQPLEPLRVRTGPKDTAEYVVTVVTTRHHVVRATSPAQARKRAERELGNRPGQQVTEVERL